MVMVLDQMVFHLKLKITKSLKLMTRENPIILNYQNGITLIIQTKIFQTY